MNTRNSIVLSEHDIVKLDNSASIYSMSTVVVLPRNRTETILLYYCLLLLLRYLDYLHLKPRTVKQYIYIYYTYVLCNIMYTNTKTKRSKKYMFYINNIAT